MLALMGIIDNKRDHAMDIIKNIEVFGDSIFKGVQLNPANNRYHVDNQIGIDDISEKYDVSIDNFSKFGNTIGKGYEAIQKRLGSGKFCDMMIMDFGGNDCDFDWKAVAEAPDAEHQPHTPLDVFTETYYKIIGLLKDNGIVPVLTTLPPLAPQKFFDWFCGGLNKVNVMKWLVDVDAIYRFQENYSRTVEKIARTANVPLVDLRGAFLRNLHADRLLCEDGIHPNTEGQKTITAAFMEFAENVMATRLAGLEYGNSLGLG